MIYKLPADKRKLKANVFHDTCPARYLLAQISGKWSFLLIDVLADKNMRNGELIRAIEGISQKMLTQTLKEFEEMKIVVRTDMKTVPPHVEYNLTSTGQELREKICSLDRWVEDNMLELIEGHRGINLVP